MRRTAALLAASVLLVLSAAPALAEDPTPEPVVGGGSAETPILLGAPATIAGGYEIRALEGPDGTLEVQGKLWIDGGSIGASVGCNTLGGKVLSIEADLVRFGATMTTEMGCAPELAAGEALLLRLFAGGELRLVGDALVSPAGRILVVPPVAVDPGIATPSTAPGETPVDPNPGEPAPTVFPFALEQCIGILPDEELAPFGLGPLGVPAPGDVISGGGTSGSSGSSGGSAGSGSSGGSGESTPVAPPPMPAESGGLVDPVPMPAETSAPAPTSIAVDPILVDPGVPAVDGGIVPGATDAPSSAYRPTEEECRALLDQLKMSIRTLGGGAAVEDGIALPTAELAADTGAADPATSALRGLIVLALGGAAWLLSTTLARRRRGTADPD